MGKSQADILAVTDIDEVYANLKSKDVKFTQEPMKERWGTYAILKDSMIINCSLSKYPEFDGEFTHHREYYTC